MILVQKLLLVQGLYYAVTGLWTVLHLRSFMRVTGFKTDRWLVKTVGLLIAAIGLSLLTASSRLSVQPETAMLAAAAALALFAVDVLYTLRRVISPVYLADAAAEAGLLGVWAATVWGRL